MVESVHGDAYLQALVGGGAGHLTAFYLKQENFQCYTNLFWICTHYNALRSPGNYEDTLGTTNVTRKVLYRSRNEGKNNLISIANDKRIFTGFRSNVAFQTEKGAVGRPYKCSKFGI